jgi:hypothetical protein
MTTTNKSSPAATHPSDHPLADPPAVAVADQPAPTEDPEVLAAEMQAIVRARTTNVVVVDQPLVLISQMPRSGGTLLMRLFDGHPQCHTIAHEFGGELGRPFPVGTREQLWNTIASERYAAWFASGFKTYQRKGTEGQGGSQRLPFLVSPTLHRAIFEKQLPERPTDRDVANAYLTGYFNAWLDNQNLNRRPKSWVTAFEPQASTSTKLTSRVREIYPDGRIISIVREPGSWYASARGWSEEWTAVVPAITMWQERVDATIALKHELGDAMQVVLFEDLVRNPTGVMRSLCDWLTIRFAREVRAPTFNGLPVLANTSFRADVSDVSTDPLKRAKALSDSDRSEVAAGAGDAYERAAAVAIKVRDR